MEQKNYNKGIIALLVVIIVILAVLCILFATGTLSLKSKEVTNDSNKQTNENIGSDVTNTIDDNSQKEEEKQNEQGTIETTLTKDEAMNIVKSVMKKSFNYIYALSPECGDRSINDSFQEDNLTYEASSSYKTQAELKAYLHTFLSDNIIKSVEEKYVVDMYKEKDNKLYCLNSRKGCGWIYNDDDTNYTIGTITNNEINAGGNIFYETCGNEKKAIPVSFVLKKNSNNNWILDTYLTK